jgi:hypothetical protein
MDPAENPVLEFDFSSDLTAIDGLVTVSISPTGAALLDGAHQISGTSVLQRIKHGETSPGINYTVRCEALGGLDRRVRAATLPVRTA